MYEVIETLVKEAGYDIYDLAMLKEAIDNVVKEAGGWDYLKTKMGLKGLGKSIFSNYLLARKLSKGSPQIVEDLMRRRRNLMLGAGVASAAGLASYLGARAANKNK